jgi:AP-1 complex subunit beta-1
VLAAVKVVFLHMRNISPEMMKSYAKKMAPPLGMYNHRSQLECP